MKINKIKNIIELMEDNVLKNIAVFASGNGSNFEAIVNAHKAGDMPKTIVSLLICDSNNAFALQRAYQLNIKAFVVEYKHFESKIDYEKKILDILNQNNIDFICLAGYMKIIGNVLLRAFPNRILNIHPSLLPSFKGAHAIEYALRFGVKVFGVTVHIIDNTIDGGTIIAQRGFEYYGKILEELEQKVHAVEHKLYPEAINAFVDSNFDKES